MRKNRTNTNRLRTKTIVSVAFVFLCISTTAFSQEKEEQDLKPLPTDERLNKEMYSNNTRILDITGINILKDFDKILEEITAKDIAKTASFIVDKDSKRTIILQPE